MENNHNSQWLHSGFMNIIIITKKKDRMAAP